MAQLQPATTPKLALEKLEVAAPNQITRHNTNLALHDAIIQGTAISRTTSAPPGSESEGDVYIIPSGATGAWSGKSTKIAAYYNGAYVYITPQKGWIYYIDDEDSYYKKDTSAWVEYTPAPTTAPTLTVVAKTASFTASTSEAAIYSVSAASGDVVATLPTAASAANRSLTFKRTDASANSFTIDGAGSETIDGELTIALTQYDSVTVVSDGTSWLII